MENNKTNIKNKTVIINKNIIKTPELSASNLMSLNDIHLFDDISNNKLGENDESYKKETTNLNNYNTEIGCTNINKILSNIKCPLKKLSENIVIKNIKKTACKTSIELTSLKNKIKQSSKKLYDKSEAYVDSKAQKVADNDSEMDSEISDNSLDDPSRSEKSKSKFNDLIAKYYMGSAENVSGNYDAYVTNCLKLISYFKKRDYFVKLNLYNNLIDDLNDRYYNKLNKLSSLNNITSYNSSNIEGNSNSNKNEIKTNKDEEAKKATCFEFSSNKQLLILDLDETLIHSDLDLKYSAHDKYIELSDGSVIPLNIRPYVKEFLEFCLDYFDIVIYTASCSDYADPILDYLEDEIKGKFFKYRLYREHCVVYGNFFIKDLIIFNKPLEKTIIVDNNLFSFSHYLNNGVLVTSFYNESDDLDLLSLIEFFKASIINTNDVRKEIASTFEFEKILTSLKNIK